jgi:hypothetical protein
VFQVFRCAIAGGTPRPLEADAVKWVKPAELERLKFPPANRPLIARLTAPEV